MARTREVATAMLVSALTFAGCAQRPANPDARADYDRADDPAEPTNRAIFAANMFVDRHALKPVARAYAANVPRPVRGGIRNFVGNLAAPEIAVNDVLQGNLGRAATTSGRFLVNTTLGGLGVFDVASGWDMPAHEASFGQTLGVWGVGPGPAVQLPLLGPSNVRDSIGSLLGLVANPASYVPGGAAAAVSASAGGLGAIDGRAGRLSTTDKLEANSVDYYATLRSLAAQRSAALVAAGRAGGSPAGMPRTAPQVRS